jgi:hypothetical protein
MPHSQDPFVLTIQSDFCDKYLEDGALVLRATCLQSHIRLDGRYYVRLLHVAGLAEGKTSSSCLVCASFADLQPFNGTQQRSLGLSNVPASNQFVLVPGSFVPSFSTVSFSPLNGRQPFVKLPRDNVTVLFHFIPLALLSRSAAQ